MATHVLAEVLEHSRAEKGDRLVIIVLADQASKQTREAQVGLDVLMRHTLLSERAVRYSLRKLAEMGEISIVTQRGRGNWNVYRVNPLPVVKGAKVAPFQETLGDEKGAKVAPFNDPEKGQFSSVKGAICDTEKGQSATDTYSGKYSGCPVLEVHPHREQQYPPEFETTWAIYPTRLGSNPKQQAFRCWQARRKEGHTADEIRQGVERYRAWCTARGQTNTEFVMQAKRFLGPEKEFRKPWPAPIGQTVQQGSRLARKTFDDYDREMTRKIEEAGRESSAIPGTCKRLD